MPNKPRPYDAGRLTEAGIEAINERSLGTFSSGPWTAHHDPDGHMLSWIKGGSGQIIAFGVVPAHAEFIAHAWHDIGALCAKLREMDSHV
jgi:hypothetical protein